MNRNRMLVILGGLILLIGARLPWMSVPVLFGVNGPADHAIEIARRQLARADNPDVRLLQEDAFNHQPAEPYDCAVASMCFHHFSNARILALLQRLRGFVTHSVLINDLRRSRLASLAARLLLAGIAVPKGVRHDALLSIRRGFKLRELSTLLRQLDRVRRRWSDSQDPAAWARQPAPRPRRSTVQRPVSRPWSFQPTPHRRYRTSSIDRGRRQGTRL